MQSRQNKLKLYETKSACKAKMQTLMVFKEWELEFGGFWGEKLEGLYWTGYFNPILQKVRN